MEARSTVLRWTSGDWAVLRRSILFRGSPVESTRRITTEAEAGLVPCGHVFHRCGDRIDRLRLVLSGGALIERDEPGGELVCLEVCEAGRTYGDFAALLDRPTTHSARAAGVVRFMSLPAEPFRRLLAEDGEAAISIIASAAAHARATTDHLVRLKAMSGVWRAGDLLLKLSRDNGGRVRFVLPYEKSVLGHSIGLRPESFSRALSQLAAVGVTFEGDFVQLTSPERLRAFVTNCFGSHSAKAV
ncbi:MAG: helix-turn-helix domain-containing protein [Siculibacillus sp.]|nr:helix-turn-helix domain-containing protein [Siculibacillus sp.]